MMKEFKELLMKKAKDGKFLSEEDKAAKMDVLNEIKGTLSEMMGDDLKRVKGMKKVTVASPTEEGLKEGLEKAGDVVDEKLDSEDEESEEESEDTEEEMPMEDGMMEHSPEMKMMGMSKADKIKKLEEELAKLKSESEEEAMA